MNKGNLIVGDVALEMVEAIQPLVARIKRQDKSLADQLVRAASSVVLNIAESDYPDRRISQRIPGYTIRRSWSFDIRSLSAQQPLPAVNA